MSERTTIGGTVYETVGSSTSNLLLKCNGTARIQWGNKLIDLIKNGKIASSDSQQMIFTISDEADVKSDGIYILTTEEQDKLLLSKDGNIYNLTEFDLYISANKEQNLTVDQKNQALFNIGMFYDSLEEVKEANIKNGVVYIIKEKTFYTIRDGIIEEFKAKIKTVEVEKQTTEETINSSVKITLSINDKEYLILADERITANYSIHVKESEQIGSESANQSHGYRLYMEGGTSYLDVDEINVRNGLPSQEYKEITHEELLTLIQFKTLKPHQWYLIKDFQNHWKLTTHNLDFNRPILIRALTNSTFYEEGELFKDRRVKIHYDPSFQETINQLITDKITNKAQRIDIKTRGLITWMKDAYGNEANFDFLDYTDDAGKPLTYLHDSVEDSDYLDKSIFPKGSYNNKITIKKSIRDGKEFLNLYGTVIGVKKIVWEGQEVEIQSIVNSNTYRLEFLFEDSKDPNNPEKPEPSQRMLMYNNNIECFGLTVPNECSTFYNNVIKYDTNLEDEQNANRNLYFRIVNNYTHITNCTFINTCHSVIGGDLDSCQFINVYNSYIHPQVIKKIRNSTFKNIHECQIDGSINDSYFNNIKYKQEQQTNEFNFVWNSKNKRYDLTFDTTLISSSITKSNICHLLTSTFASTCTLQNITIGVENNNDQKSENCSFQSGTYKNSQFNLLKGCTFSLENQEFSGNTFNLVENMHFTKQTIINNSSFKKLYITIIDEDEDEDIVLDFIINNCNFGEFDCSECSISSTIFESSTFENVSKCEFNTSVFTSSTFKNVTGCVFNNSEFESSTFENVSYWTSSTSENMLLCNFDNTKFITSTFKNVTGCIFNNVDFTLNTVEDVLKCEFNGLTFTKNKFQNLINCVFSSKNKGELINITAHNHINAYNQLKINPENYAILFDITKTKEVYFSRGDGDKKADVLSITIIKESTFFRGMITMYYSSDGIIPEGWAICDGEKYTYKGIETQTPNLKDKFIKANVFSKNENKYICGEFKNPDVNDNNELTLQKKHLPAHNHPHKAHTHTITDTTVTIEESGNLEFSFTQPTSTLDIALQEGEAITTVEGEGVITESDNFITNVIDSSQTNSEFVTITGGNHKHPATVTTGTISKSTSQESTQTWENKAIKIEPNYYSLIFIIKL